MPDMSEKLTLILHSLLRQQGQERRKKNRQNLFKTFDMKKVTPVFLIFFAEYSMRRMTKDFCVVG